MQDTPTKAALDVAVQYYDLMTGNPIGSERRYTASAATRDYGQSTNLQVRNVANRIMADWSSSLATAPAANVAPRAMDARTSDADRAEIAFWQTVRDSKNRAELQAYLDRFPNGAFVPLARARLAALGR
jgi:hypothetical protein